VQQFQFGMNWSNYSRFVGNTLNTGPRQGTTRRMSRSLSSSRTEAFSDGVLSIGAAWLGHTSITARLSHVDPVLLRINLLLLLLVAFLPFPTRLVADAAQEERKIRWQSSSGTWQPS
jgi:hypothetical protein